MRKKIPERRCLYPAVRGKVPGVRPPSSTAPSARLGDTDKGLAASHHAVCVTDDQAAVVAFLQQGLGLRVGPEVALGGSSTASVLGWPEGNPGANGLMLGSGSGGLVEVVGVPPSLFGTVQPGIAMLSFAVKDLEATVLRCHRLGLAASEITRLRSEGVDVSMALVLAGGIRFELVRYESGGPKEKR